VAVNLALRQGFLTSKTGEAAYIAFAAFYALCALVTWVVYLRRTPNRLVGV
jgi:NNP family nitrate/nitrite transporter-like MFS transporter